MCCLFTCCGWMIDLIQRLWTFTMSCCISSAVCCSLVTASMSGIALGYNYSLAEYIDLKETNVSVYLKRGVFDDEIGDDMDWRRSGHQPVAGHIGENNLRTGAPEEEASSIRSGRRLDDSIYESDDRNKFEGSLMRLTAKAPAPSPTTQSETNTEVDMDQVLSKHRMGSVDQMKAIQTLINMRKSADSRRKTASGEVKTKEFYLDERYLPHVPIHPGSIGPGRRLMPSNGPGVHSTPGNSARLAVSDESINEEAKWLRPKLPPEAFTRDSFGNYDVRATYPMPVTPRAGPVRPTRPKPVYRPRPTLTTSPSTPLLGQQELGYPKSIDEDMDAFKNKLLLDKYESPSFKDEDFVKDIKGPRRNYEDYEEAAKGVPIRRKRNSLIFFKTLKGKTLKTSDDANNKSDTTGLHILVKSRELSKKAENENNDSENGPPLTVYENIKSTTSPNTVTASSSILIKLLQTTVS